MTKNGPILRHGGPIFCHDEPISTTKFVILTDYQKMNMATKWLKTDRMGSRTCHNDDTGLTYHFSVIEIYENMVKYIKYDEN